MSGLPRWVPGVVALRARRPFLAAGQIAGAAGLVILWIARGPTLGPALLEPEDLDMFVAAWTSLVLAGLLVRPADSRHRRRPARRHRFATTGCALVVGVTLLAPALMPHEPDRIGPGVASHHLPPLSRLHLLSTRDGSVIAASRIELDGDRVRVRRGATWTSLPRSELAGSRPADWHRSRLHLLGTDHLGRDLLSRILSGARVSLGIGVLAALVAGLLGAGVGGLSGWAGPRVDGALMRFTDAMLSFPRLFLVLLVLTVVPGSFLAVVAVLGLTGWMVPCRLVRSVVLSLRERDFIRAARVAGCRDMTIVGRHLLPNALGPLVVATTLRIGDTILIEAGLSFLGLGVPPPHATWGNIISGGRPALAEAWWVATFPGLALVITVVLFNLLGESLRSRLEGRPEAPEAA